MSGVWKRMVVLALCICLLSACGTARNQVLSVSVSETGRLRDLLIRKQINVSFVDSTHLEGRVKELAHLPRLRAPYPAIPGLEPAQLVVDVKKSTGPSPVPLGLQGVPMDRISTVKFTRYQGDERTRLATWFALGAIPLVAVLDVGDSTSASAGALVGIGILGYLWGRNKDKQNVTLTIKQPDVSRGP